MAGRTIRIKELIKLITHLGVFGANKQGGVNRLALSYQDKEARDFLCNWFQENGFHTQIDSVGNIFGVLEIGTSSSQKVFMCGSHLDSQPNGGRFDGTLGVAFACIVGLSLKEMIDSGESKSLYRYYVVACWTSEEGARFQPSLLGSRVFSRNMPLEVALNLTDSNGVSVETALTEIGYKGNDITNQPDHYLEVHIEQGKFLEAAGHPIGVVYASWGTRKIILSIKGKMDHTGPTPMDQRFDALVAASNIIIKVNEIAELSSGLMHSSVGRMDIYPNSPNTVAEKANLWIEFRSADEVGLDAAEEELRIFVTKLREKTRCSFEETNREIRQVVKFDKHAFNKVCDAMNKSKIPHLKMTTIAGHDALQLQSICPSTLIFVPSKDGISHSPNEFTSEIDIKNGFEASLIAISGLIMKTNS